MAGAGEACSHIAALLYSTMAKADMVKNTSCILQKDAAGLLIPSQFGLFFLSDETLM